MTLDNQKGAVRFLAAFLIAMLNGNVRAGIIGTNLPAQPLTLERIGLLSAAEQPAWKKYLARSSRQLHADREFLGKELHKYKLEEPTSPPGGSSVRSIPLDNPPGWYGTAEA